MGCEAGCLQKGSTCFRWRQPRTRGTRELQCEPQLLSLLQESPQSVIMRSHQPASAMEPVKPSPKKLTPKRFLEGKPTVQTTEFSVGDAVYARYHGDRVLRIVGIAKVDAPFPHYLCEVDGDVYLVPKLHLSTRSLLSEVSGGNRRQLQLPV